MPPTQIDFQICMETWYFCVRTRSDISPRIITFQLVEQKFLNFLGKYTTVNHRIKTEEFFALLINIIINQYYDDHFKIQKLKSYTNDWDAVGRALFDTLQETYSPKIWTSREKDAWNRSYCQILRML